MGKKVDFDTFSNSQNAISEYMHSKTKNGHMHEARVLISSGGVTKYNRILKIIPKIDTNLHSAAFGWRHK